MDERLRLLPSRARDLPEAERRRIARELHDELGQLLTVLKIDISWVASRLARLGRTRGERELLERVHSMRGLVDGSFDAVRRILMDLRPAILDTAGLESAVAKQLLEFERRTGIRCEFHSEPLQIRPGDASASAVFGILQEALTNVARHAEASRINVILRPEGERVLLEVNDNGKRRPTIGKDGSPTMGLLGMRERALALGGTMQLAPNPAKGTRITVRIPCAKQTKPSAKRWSES